MKTSLMQCGVVALALVLGAAVLAQEMEPGVRIGRPGVGRGGAAAQPAWNQAEAVFIGELVKAETGAATMSMPPTYLNEVTLKVDKVLRGTLVGAEVTVRHAYTGEENYDYEVGGKYLVALSTSRGNTVVTRLEKAEPAAVKAAELACLLPMGWKMEGGKPVSPFAVLGKAAWAGQWPEDAAKPSLFCSVTGRPALSAGVGAAWSAEVVPPAKLIEWTNPDGDGLYKLTVTNPTDRPVVVPALLTQDGKILWQESVVILCQGKSYLPPGAKGVTGKVEPLTLQPGQSVSTEINALALQGPDWPRGGYRIEFTFCLGDQAQTMSFYYMSRHHDPIRAKAK